MFRKVTGVNVVVLSQSDKLENKWFLTWWKCKINTDLSDSNTLQGDETLWIVHFGWKPFDNFFTTLSLETWILLDLRQLEIS